MVAMVAASGYGTLRRFLSAADGELAGAAVGAAVAVSSKQRASVKWLLSKAFNNRVPENLLEPFYRDHEDQEHLKPPILGAMANAEMYCLALANMYSDPNYHSLNHWNILQTLARKGVHIADPPDCALTETVLIQTNPLKMSAHMAVIEAMMTLYTKEVVTWDRVAAAAQRFGAPPPSAPPATVPHEEGLVVWINSACAALNRAEADESSPQLIVPKVQNLQELCDGTALSALISFYCPDALPKNRVRVGRVSSLQDCLHNLMLVYEFCHKFLPHNVFHMLPEDVTYMRGSMRQNLIVMLADLFNMLEIHPVKCVKYPGSVPRSPSASQVHGRSRGIMGSQRSACSTPERRSVSPQSHFFNQEESFVVHRGKTVPTLSSVVRQDERTHMDANMTAAGRPSNWEDQRRASGVLSGGSYAGRRSRRSSITDDSQLTVENFGGSQDRLNFLGRNPEKELATVNSMRKISAPAGPIEPNLPIRSTKQDAKGSIQFIYSDAPNGPAEERTQKPLERQSSQPQSNEPACAPYHPIRRQLSSDTITLNQNSGFSNKGGGDGGFYLNNSNRDTTDGDISLSKLSNFTDMNKLRSNGDQSGMQLVYSQQEKEDEDMNALQQQRKKSTTFAMLPNSTTWQQQSIQHEQHPNGDGEQMSSHDDGSSNGGVMATQLNNIRMKLEEKRRRIEQEKKRVELSMNRQRQQVGQQAFLQAVTRSKGASNKSPSEGVSSGDASTGDSTPAASRDLDGGKPERPFTLQEISSDVQNVENKWLDHENSAPFVETRRTPDLDGMGLEEYHQSIAKMNSSLQDIQSDIARLASQQSQLQSNQIYQHQHPPPHQQQQIHQQQQHLQHHQQQLQQQQQQQLQQQQQQQQQQQIQQQQQLFHQQQQQQQQMYQQAQNQQNIPQLHNQYSSQHNVSSGPIRQYPGLHGTSFGSTPHLPQEQHSYAPPAHHFYLHDNVPQPQRRTWAQHAQLSNQLVDLSHENRGWQLHQQSSPYQQPHAQPQYQESPQRSWKSPSPQPVQEMRTWNHPQSFVLHDRSNQQSSPFPVHHARYQNGTEHSPQNHLSYTVINPAPCHQPSPQTLFSQSPPRTASPQHRVKPPQRQPSYGELSRQPGAVSLQQLTATTHQAPVPAPPADDMEPQNISFIGSAEDEALQQGINRLNISSGTRTYRIPSPTRPSLSRNSFQHPVHEVSHPTLDAADLDQGDPSNEKGFYISFDNDQPKRPKPPLRPKRGSPKKEQSPPDYRSPERGGLTERSDRVWQDRVPEPTAEEEFIVHRNVLSSESGVRNETPMYREPPVARRSEPSGEPAAIIIGNDLSNPDPDSVEEMEKKKERIMMLSLQRRQRAEEARARQEQQAAAKKQREMLLQEQRSHKKEEQSKRRDAILQQYKLKKAIEEAEREGKVIDKAELLALTAFKTASSISSGTSTIGHAAGAKMRSKIGNTGTRTRPKTIHVDSGTVELAEGMLASRGKQGSSTNLTAFGNTPQSTMRRDYYRGSQDSLADRAGLYRDSPVDDSRGMSPGGGSTSALGRRGSYKTSRERVNEVDPQSQTRGRSKYSTYQNNFKTGRKSSSLMNLCDSGLGRATPPRRAPSPGVRALPSPSGPGSLPGGIGKRLRHFDDGASDVSSTPSSIMDYSGPRLYKQPTTKSNRGIMLNAVEYCVFPGVVNREAKRRVLEEIARSESKHFLVLFRDAGCQFRALYSYCPDREEVTKLYGTGPRQVNDRMFDKFFKYNSGSKCFSQVHTKHLTVTIDAFTIHNSLWQGKKVQLPSKKDMALVI